MSKDYDIIIIGNSLHDSMLASEAAKSGLKVHLLSKTNSKFCVNNEPFILFEQEVTDKLFKHLKQHKVVEGLKKIAPHLLISTQIEQHKSLGLYSRALIRLYNILSKQKINIRKVAGQKRVYSLSYYSYKISTTRLSIELIKSIEKNMLSLSCYNQLLSYHFSSENIYHIDYLTDASLSARKISTSSILSREINIHQPEFKASQAKTIFEHVFSISYPSKKLKLEHNFILEFEQFKLKIIPWFEWVYFEISSIHEYELDIHKLLEFLKIYIPTLKLEKNEIAYSNSFKRVPKPNNSKEFYYTYTINNQKHIITTDPYNHSFASVHRTIKKVFKWYRKGINAEPLLGEFILKGSDFKFPSRALHLMEYCDEKYDEAKQILKSSLYFKKLFYRYGTQIEEITNRAFENWNKTKNSKHAWLKAEIWYAIKHEYCKSADEFIYNRTEEWMAGKNNDIEIIKNAFEDLLKED